MAEHTSGVLLDLLLDRGIDVACMNVPADAWQPPPGVCLAPIATFDLVLAVHPRHRLGGLQRVRLAELVGEPLILPPHPDLALWVVELADAPLGGQAVVAWTERGIRTKAVQAMVQHAQGWTQDLPRLG